MKKPLFFWILPLLLLASCGPLAASQPPATVAPVTLPPTWTPTAATALPTATEFPTFTPVPAITFPTPTIDPLAALSEHFQDSLFAPGGKWVARRDPKKLRIVNTEDALRVWTLPCELFKQCSTIYPIRWANSHDLYFAPAPETGGAPNGMILLAALAKIDVRTGKWDLVLPDSDHPYDFTFSPDEEYLAYAQSSGTEADAPSVTVGVLTLKNQKVQQQFTLDGAYGGNIVWSPFKPRFVFVVQSPGDGSSVGYYDIESNFLKYTLSGERSDFTLFGWDEVTNLVTLEARDWDTNQRSYELLNPFTDELSPLSITATPLEVEISPTSSPTVTKTPIP